MRPTSTLARTAGFDAVVTISNQLPVRVGEHPTEVDKRRLKKVALIHMPWAQVLTEAVVIKKHKGVADPDQAWILGELIRYLEHPRSGALEFSSMGPNWVKVRDAVATGTLRATDRGAGQVAARWEQLLHSVALRLTRDLGSEVAQVLTKEERDDPAAREQRLVDSMVSLGVLTGTLRIPGSVGPISLTADIRARQVSASVEIQAPREGKPLTRINWLLRQLRQAPDHLRVDAFFSQSRDSSSELLKDLRGDPGLLLVDPKREIRVFRVTQAVPMGTKRDQGEGSFVSSVLALVEAFYGTVVQGLRPWTAAAPKLPRPAPEVDDVVPAPPAVEVDAVAVAAQDRPDEPDPLPPQEQPEPLPPDGGVEIELRDDGCCWYLVEGGLRRGGHRSPARQPTQIAPVPA